MNGFFLLVNEKNNFIEHPIHYYYNTPFYGSVLNNNTYSSECNNIAFASYSNQEKFLDGITVKGSEVNQIFTHGK